VFYLQRYSLCNNSYQQQDRQFTYNVTLRNHCCRGKAISITYWSVGACVCVRACVWVRGRVHARTCLSSPDNLIRDSAEVKRKAGQRGSTAHAAQPFSVRFKNIVIKLAGLCSFFQAVERSGVSEIFNKHNINKQTE
jgi:hypothetical protein